ncbi:MAG: hypothetical protein RL199_854 [Pseudomonadota bacterium]
MSDSVRVAKPRCIVDDFPRTALFEASAGTGKTYAIERLVVEMLLEHGLSIRHVLVVTFTRKAASEMAGRIHKCLHDLLHKPEPYDGPGPAWVIDDSRRRLLATALADFDQASISTIHRFCQKVLDEQVVLSGALRTPSPPPVDDLLHDAFASHLRVVAAQPSEARQVVEQWTLLQGDLAALEALVGAACRAVVTPDAPLARLRPRLETQALVKARAALVAAFAGPLPSTVAEVMADGVSPRTKDAEAKVFASVLQAFRSVQALTVDAVARDLSPRAFQLRFLNALGPLLKDEPPAAFVNPSGVKGLSGPLLRAIRALFEEAPTAESVVVDVLLAPVHAAFEALCRRRGASDFQRLLTDTVEAVRGDATGALAARLRDRFRGVLVDEFQDTDELQWEILRRLFVDPGSKSRFVAVGDPKQAIYGFRGGDFQTYVQARQVLRSGVGQADAMVLAENRRSTQEMVDAYNRLLLTKAKVNDTKSSPLEPFFGPEEHGVVYDASSKVSAAGDPGRLVEAAGGAPVRPLGLFRLHDLKTDAARAMLRGAIVREARALVSGDFLLEVPENGATRSRAVEARDLMVLVSTNREARDYVDALAAAGVAAEQYRAEGLMQSPEAEEVADLLEALARPDKPGAISVAMRTLFFDVPFDELEQLPGLSSHDPRLLRWRHWARLAARRSWVELFADLRSGTQLNRRLALTAEHERRLGTVNAVLDVVHRVARDGCAGIGELARRMRALVEEAADLPSEDDNIHPATDAANAARVLTVFKAKGLEAPVVFLATAPHRDPPSEDLKVFHEGQPPERLTWTGSTKGMPQARQAVSREADLENRRFQYVALTRARHRLWLPELTAAPTESQLRDGITAIRADTDAGTKYKAINQRLFLLREEPDFQALCEVREHPLPGAEELPPGKVPADLAAAPSPVKVDTKTVRGLAAGLQLGSYSSLKKLAFVAPVPEKPTVERAGAELMPNGASAGTLLHALIERVPLTSVQAGRSLDDWRALPEVATLLDGWWRESRWAPGPRRDTERMAHAGLHHPIVVEGLSLPPLGTLGKELHREVEFHLPWPSSAQPLGLDVDGPWRIDRGLLKGTMDFAFQHGGRVYFGDWKSNGLESYDRETVERSVRASYEAQLRIYTLALCRLYRWKDASAYEASFGGALYVYLRGFDGSGRGVVHLRPTWEDLVELDRRLQAGVHEAQGEPEARHRVDVAADREDESDEELAGEAA